MNFTAQDFTEVQGESAKSSLIKFAVFKKISELTNIPERAQMSTKYQVLCNETAMVGVLKQPEGQKSSFFTKEVAYKFDKQERDMREWRRRQKMIDD